MDSYVSFGGRLICPECVIAFPYDQVDSHGKTKHHAGYCECTPGVAICKVCKFKYRVGSSHEQRPEHMKAVTLLKSLEEHSWDEISMDELPNLVAANSSRANHLLREKFDADATALSHLLEGDLLNEKKKAQDPGSRALLASLVELERMRSMETSAFPYREVLDTYDEILSYSEKASEMVWVLQHPSLKASYVLQAIKSAGSQILEEDGFWVVNNKSTAIRPGKNLLNLHQLLRRCNRCRMKLQKHRFGASSQALTTCKDGESKTFLYDFIVKSLAIEKKIDELMEGWVGGGARFDIFREALFYHMPTTLEILYDHDLDINRHCDTMPLGFTLQGGDSLVDAKADHLQLKCLDDESDSVFEIYDFSSHDLEAIKHGECKTAHSFPLLDDAFGECVRLWCEGNVRPTRGLEIIHGVNRGAIIASTFGTRTSIHVEDGVLGTFNFLVAGAPKIWYFVPLSSGLEFKEFLKGKKWLHSSLMKRCYPQTFSGKRTGVHISTADMRRFGVRRIVQHPGMTVMSVPGLMYHWTISTGFSLADSANYFINIGQDLRGLQDMWNKYHLEASGSVRNCAAVATTAKYFDLCRSFKLL